MTFLSRSSAFTVVLSSMLSLSSGTLYAQTYVSGVVTNEAGAPIAGAVVEAWLLTKRIAWAEADGAGRFRFSVAPPGDSVTIAVRAIGFRPARASVKTHAFIRISLLSLPLDLPELSASIESVCPSKNDSVANRAWQAAASGREHGGGFLEATFQSYDDVVDLPDFGIPHRAATGDGRFGITDLGRRQYQALLRAKGYGWPSLEVGSSEWVYPALESSMVEELFTLTFAQDHSFFWKSDQRDVLVFCARKRSRPYIDGEVALTADATLLSIQWFFHGGRVRTPAGGGAVFLPSGPKAGGRNFPLLGIFWRQLKDGTFSQRTFQYTEWLVGKE